MDSYPDPAMVGKAFVKQYYTQMHKDPAQLHRFYLDQSSFVHGGSDIGSEDPVIGQQAIYEKIVSLDLQQVHAKIKQVDSHATLGNGIVIQVTGELSTSGRPMRAFVQTFVLAPESPKKYYVHNDIFRYQDDDLVSESETNDVPGEGDNPAIAEQSPEEGDYPPPSHSPRHTSPEVGKEEGLYVGQTADLTEQGLPEEAPELRGMGGASGWDQYVDQTRVTENGIEEGRGDGPHGPSSSSEPSQEYPIESLDQVEEAGEVIDGYSSVEAQEIEESKGPSTWASRVGKVSQSQPPLSHGRPLHSTVVPSQPLPQREPRARKPDVSRPPIKDLPPPSSSKKGPPAFIARDAPDSYQIFVGGLPQHATEAEVKEVFGAYGNIVEVRINAKNFAFVVFDKAEPVQRIISEKDSIQIRSKQLNIEPKRPSGARSGPRGGKPPLGGGGGGGFGGGGGRVRPPKTKR